jgi:hypothetical protein
MPILKKRKGEKESSRMIRTEMANMKQHPEKFPGGRRQAIAIGLSMYRSMKKAIKILKDFNKSNKWEKLYNKGEVASRPPARREKLPLPGGFWGALLEKEGFTEDPDNISEGKKRAIPKKELKNTLSRIKQNTREDQRIKAKLHIKPLKLHGPQTIFGNSGNIKDAKKDLN